MRLPFDIREGLGNEMAQAKKSPWTLRLDWFRVLDVAPGWQ
jgi:hypothetical protein